MIKMKKKFRKLSVFQHRVEDDLNKLEYLFGVQKNFSVRSSCSSNTRGNKGRLKVQTSPLVRAVRITEANDANLKALYHIYRKRFD